MTGTTAAFVSGDKQGVSCWEVSWGRIRRRAANVSWRCGSNETFNLSAMRGVFVVVLWRRGDTAKQGWIFDIVAHPLAFQRDHVNLCAFLQPVYVNYSPLLFGDSSRYFTTTTKNKVNAAKFLYHLLLYSPNPCKLEQEYLVEHTHPAS
jgi:hypothetical protein